MADSKAIWVIVPAAGSGQRMRSSLPKQYLPIKGVTILEHTINKFLSMDIIAGVIVALAPNDTRFESLAIASHPKVTTTTGGAERSESVLSALGVLKSKILANDWVLVHDAARPCITQAAVKALIEAVKDHSVGGILGVPVSDTLKHVDHQLMIESTVDRQNIWQAQTPQLFRYGILLESLRLALNLGNAVTDEASALEMSGYQPQIVAGHRDNIKITHSEDLAIAEFVLDQQLKSL